MRTMLMLSVTHPGAGAGAWAAGAAAMAAMLAFMCSICAVTAASCAACSAPAAATWLFIASSSADTGAPAASNASCDGTRGRVEIGKKCHHVCSLHSG